MTSQVYLFDLKIQITGVFDDFRSGSIFAGWGDIVWYKNKSIKVNDFLTFSYLLI